MNGSIEFYFDFSSPNAYFSFVQLRRLKEDENLTIELEPVFLGGIMSELETTAPAMQNELKAEYLRKDLLRWFEKYEVPFEFNDHFPLNSIPALRGVLLLEQQSTNFLQEYVHRVFRAAWAENVDISEPAELTERLPEGTMDAEAFNEGITDESIKDELKERTDRAMDRGVFGCPTFFVDDEMFWGKDRLDFALDKL